MIAVQILLAVAALIAFVYVADWLAGAITRMFRS